MPRFSRTLRKTERARALRASATRTERRLWPHLSGGRLGAAFRRQHPIGPYFADYYCARLKLVVEVDGPSHDPDYDARRDAFMARLGLTVLRFGACAVTDETEGVMDAIWREVQARLRAADPHLSSPFQGEEADNHPPHRDVEGDDPRSPTLKGGG